VEVYINYLRPKLGRKAAGGGDGQSVVRTVRGEGSVLGAPAFASGLVRGCVAYA
jgi:hypothetical protein